MPSDDTAQRLLNAAGQVFAEKGFDAATVRQICQRADVNNLAAVNYYFRDKERLYIEAVKAACRCQSEDFPMPAWTAETPPVAKLRDFIGTMLKRMLSPDSPAWGRQLFLRELANPTAACAELVQDHIRPQAELLCQILQELLPGVPEHKRRLIALSIVGQCVFHRVAKPIVELLVGEEEYRTYDAARLAEHIAQFSLAALGLETPFQESSRATVVGSESNHMGHKPEAPAKVG
jgi:AcrR family transcriptional regulator